MKLRIATCATLPEPDVDEAPLLEALHVRGVDARMVAWEADGWDEPIPTVIRSTWNYIHDLPAFLAWTRRVRGPLWNPPQVIAKNVHKSYLGELATAGHAVVPTIFVARGEPLDLVEVCRARGFTRIVVKPTVGAGSFATRCFDRPDDGVEFLCELAGERDVMIQPYVPSVEAYGERSLVYISGAITHAMRKSPRFLGQDESVTGPHPIADEERALAEAVLAPYARDLLYGRVDMANDEHGRPMVMELELVEPSLFLLEHPPALVRFVDALVDRLA
jgi:hypothetical protein